MEHELPYGLRFSLLSRFFKKRLNEQLMEKELTGVQLTVLKELERLEAAGVVHKVNTEDGAFYQYCGRDDHQHRDCFLLKCERCGRIRHVDCTQLQALYDHLEREHHFRINPRGTLLSGVCDVCAGEEGTHHGDR